MEEHHTAAEIDLLNDLREVRKKGFGKITVIIQSGEIVAVETTPRRKYGKGEVRLPSG